MSLTTSARQLSPKTTAAGWEGGSYFGGIGFREVVTEGKVEIRHVRVDGKGQGEGHYIPFTEPCNLVSVHPRCCVKYIAHHCALCLLEPRSQRSVEC